MRKRGTDLRVGEASVAFLDDGLDTVRMVLCGRLQRGAVTCGSGNIASSIHSSLLLRGGGAGRQQRGNKRNGDK